VAAVAAQSLERRTGRAIGNIDLAIASTTADQKARLVRRVFQETQIAHRAVVHGQFHLLSWGLKKVTNVEPPLSRCIMKENRSAFGLAREIS